MSEKNENVYDLSFFMPGKTIEAEEIKVPISKRFVDKKGNVIPFILKPITTERIDELEKENTTFKNVKRPRQCQRFRLPALLCENCHRIYYLS